MEASKDCCQERLERVNALGTEVVPEVRPIRKDDSGSPSASRPSARPVRGWAPAAAPALPGPLQRLAQPLNDLRPQLLRPRRIQDGALPLTRHSGGEGDREVRGIPFGQHRDSAAPPAAVACGCVAETGPAQPPARHDDGGVVGAFIGPALESVEKRHRTNFTGRNRLHPCRQTDYCDNMSFNDNVQLDPSQVQDRRAAEWAAAQRSAAASAAASSCSWPRCSASIPQLLEGLAGAGHGTARPEPGHGAPACKPARTPTPAGLPDHRHGQQPQRVLAGVSGRLQGRSTPGPRP